VDRQSAGPHRAGLGQHRGVTSAGDLFAPDVCRAGTDVGTGPA
jgi:hypothetical protein